MARKRYKPEEIVNLLRQAEVLDGQRIAHRMIPTSATSVPFNCTVSRTYISTHGVHRVKSKHDLHSTAAASRSAASLSVATTRSPKRVPARRGQSTPARPPSFPAAVYQTPPPFQPQSPFDPGWVLERITRYEFRPCLFFPSPSVTVLYQRLLVGNSTNRLCTWLRLREFAATCCDLRPTSTSSCQHIGQAGSKCISGFY